jgi:hypothetical protein
LFFCNLLYLLAFEWKIFYSTAVSTWFLLWLYFFPILFGYLDLKILLIWHFFHISFWLVFDLWFYTRITFITHYSFCRIFRLLFDTLVFIFLLNFGNYSFGREQLIALREFCLRYISGSLTFLFPSMKGCFLWLLNELLPFGL